MIHLRPMREADIPAGLALCRSAGWNQLSNDWQLFLDLKPNGSRVAVDETGQVIGTVATIDYEDHFTWIGMVLVDPEKKREGIGTQLLREALQILRDKETIKLDATPAGREVYLKLGFQDEYTLSRMILTEKKLTHQPSNAKKISENDLNAILKTDEEVFGAVRTDLLKRIYSGSKDLAFTKNDSYCFGRRGYNFSQIGPVISNNLEDAIAITSSAINNVEGAAVLDVMHGSAFYDWLVSVGFTEQRRLIRMFKGKNNFPGIPHRQFAILGPEFG